MNIQQRIGQTKVIKLAVALCLVVLIYTHTKFIKWWFGLILKKVCGDSGLTFSTKKGLYLSKKKERKKTELRLKSTNLLRLLIMLMDVRK